MSDVFTQLVIINCRPVSANDPNLSKRRNKSQSPLQISAILYGRAYGLVSKNIAEKFLGASEKHTSGLPSVVEISWAVSGSEQHLETSQVHVIPELEQDLVLGDDPKELYQSVHLTPPANSQGSKPEEQGESTSCPEEALPFQFNTSEDFKIQGIIPKNQQSQETLEQLVARCRTRAQNPSPLHKTVASEPEQPEGLSKISTDSLYGSFDISSNTSDSDGKWILPPPNDKLHRERTSSLQPSDADSLVDPSDNIAWELSTEASQVPSHSSQFHGWSLVETASADTHASTPEWVEDQDTTHEPQNDDFATHPGHRFWEWDVERQLWRRKGQDGSDERDWFEIPQ
ncbi:hypothetical protein FVEG_02106 [Fusarium verticillioides 7600]|uniref:Uncharacterized protein n=1 Tax=Gibberella moniliformis (strain M3125 / FGSC 7600) TaxID=334819 RepID=W7M2I9_GIBM7|nr:hypothetical protein FVEG_02106 [Fusarium verticillioides 7600]EWG39122.1 hypothetical protein FVEG_02106 [Fusarium verticillioides 7600]